MAILGDIVGVLLIDKTLSQVERDILINYYKGKGAKGLLIPGPELADGSLFDMRPATGGVVSRSDGVINFVSASDNMLSSGISRRLQSPLENSILSVGVFGRRENTRLDPACGSALVRVAVALRLDPLHIQRLPRLWIWR